MGIRCTALALLGFSALVPGGCGKEEEEDPNAKKAVLDTYAAYDAAFQDGDLERVKAHLTADNARPLSGGARGGMTRE